MTAGRKMSEQKNLKEVRATDDNGGPDPGNYYEGVTVWVSKLQDDGYRCEILAESGVVQDIDHIPYKKTVLRGSAQEIKEEFKEAFPQEFLQYFLRAFNRAIDQLETEE